MFAGPVSITVFLSVSKTSSVQDVCFNTIWSVYITKAQVKIDTLIHDPLNISSGGKDTFMLPVSVF